MSTVMVTATDPGGLSNSTSFVLTVSSTGSHTVVPPQLGSGGSEPRWAPVGHGGRGLQPECGQRVYRRSNPDRSGAAVQGLPAGLALNGSTLTGRPSTSEMSTVTLTATDPGGLSNSTSFQLTVSPAGSTTSTPPVSGPLAATVVSYNCQTGAIVIGSTGGNGSAVEYFAIGTTGWTTNANGMIEAGLRADPKPVTIRVRQNGVEGTPFVFDFGAFCSRPVRVAAETVSELEVIVLGNPTPESWVEVQVANSASEALHLRVISAQGRLLNSQEVTPTSQVIRQRVQLGDNAGTYLLQVATPTRTKTVKVIRQ
nr:putative Ig domain-containing protein [Rudanella lutea]